MNTSKCLLLGLTLFLPGVGWSQSQPAAPSQTDADLQRLQAQRERALTAAAVPINRQYQAALQQLLRAALQRGDLDGAIKVKAALGESTATPSTAGAPATTNPALGNAIGARRLAGTRWENHKIVVTFGEDGSFSYVYNGQTVSVGTWKATSATTAVTKSPDGSEQEYRWESEDRLVGDKNRGFAPLPANGAPPSKEAKNAAPGDARNSPGEGNLFGKPQP